MKNTKSDALLVEETKNLPAQTVSGSPAEMIRLAVERGADLEKLEKVMALQERYEAVQAKKAYNEAMSAFKANPPQIDKDRQVAYGNTKYKHASLYNVTQKINAELSKYGLSASWTMMQNNGSISVTCRITHRFGHSEETTLSAPPDKSGSMNAIQSIGSTITYLERYTLLALTGLSTFDQDDDGMGAGKQEPVINPKQLSQLLDLIAEKNVDLTKFLAYMKLESLETMPYSQFDKAVAAIKSKK